MRVLIIDDEPLARERIRTLLTKESDVQILAECADGASAVQAIKKHGPDLIFLDVQMPGMGGFEVLQALGEEELPLVIFVTAYDQHALKAFEVHALDYLLKPFKQARFQATLQRARERLGVPEPEGTRHLAELLARLAPARDYLSRVAVRNGERVVFVKMDAVEYIEAAGNYVVLHCGKENHILRQTLSSLEVELDPRKFIRVNRSTLVNVEQVRELQPLFKGEHALLLKNGKQLPLTRGVREIQDLLRFS